MKTNYHTHTTRCKHAYGSDEEYVLEAIAAGYDQLAFTDHAPWPQHPFEHSLIRMDVTQIEDYIQSISALKEKYKSQIDIKIGFESEYFRDRMDWMASIVDQYQLDLLVFGNHFRDFDIPKQYYGNYHDLSKIYDHYLEDAVDGMRSGLFKIFAHPDLYNRTLKKWDQPAQEVAHQICKVALETNVVLEYNLGGVRYNDGSYPYHGFWEIAALYQNPTIIGVDAHRPIHLSDETIRKQAIQVCKQLHVNLIDSIEW